TSVVDSSGKHSTLERQALETVHPALKGSLCAIHYFGFILGSGSQQIGFRKTIVGIVKRIATVYHRFHLSADAVIVDRRSPYDHIGIVHLFYNGIGIILDDATVRLAASQTS